jgi:pimeloyl-ACP methyl ester carboxylesterase
MTLSLLLLSAAFATTDGRIETRFAQVAPYVRQGEPFARTPGQVRAVVLLHGLYAHPFKKDGITGAVLRVWQLPGSILVNRLSQEADVFGFAYGQNESADGVADVPELAASVRHLRQLGYEQVVLVGFSAGGVIARDFVEDRPGAGVTKVIQVCAPNTGSNWANLGLVRVSQASFLESLTKSGRRRTLRDRSGRTIPSNVQFACVVGTAAVKGDGVVALHSQWSPDLQRQGVPAYPVSLTHWQVMRCARGAELLAELVALPQLRWDERQVARTRHVLFNTPRPAP